MKIKNPRSAMLSNFEVLQVLTEQQDKQKAEQTDDPNANVAGNLRTVQFEVTEYLKDTPCSTQDPQQIEAFLESMEPYKLTRAEKLQLLNLRPRSVVEIYIIVEECEERFTEEEVEQILNNISSILPRDDDYAAEEYEEEDTEMAQ
ncbi:HRDC-like protein [Syncephalastrum racemosum]|uniref:DNA-directed RNA polymerase III subunit RPC9 n=1 Tax=Syncephalastrum racemosum TaxID=13706 RepID=A0A1X2H828_SYNRA|nr:HRDC-like protein [Syncephalastrum racemosum]